MVFALHIHFPFCKRALLSPADGELSWLPHPAFCNCVFWIFAFGLIFLSTFLLLEKKSFRRFMSNCHYSIKVVIWKFNNVWQRNRFQRLTTSNVYSFCNGMCYLLLCYMKIYFSTSRQILSRSLYFSFSIKHVLIYSIFSKTTLWFNLFYNVFIKIRKVYSYKCY